MKYIPVYRYTAQYAGKQNELDAYRASGKANVACKEAIERAIQENYRNNSLDPKGAECVVKTFGKERTMFVLANTIRCSMWDSRYCPQIKEWAKTIHTFDEPYFVYSDAGHNVWYTLNAHPGLINLFAQQVLKLVEKENAIPCGTARA